MFISRSIIRCYQRRLQVAEFVSIIQEKSRFAGCEPLLTVQRSLKLKDLLSLCRHGLTISTVIYTLGEINNFHFIKPLGRGEMSSDV